MSQGKTDRFMIMPKIDWVNSETGQVVSIFGAGPYSPFASEEEKAKWSKVQSGFRIYDRQLMTIRGNGFATLEAAEQWIEKELNRLEGYKS